MTGHMDEACPQPDRVETPLNMSNTRVSCKPVDLCFEVTEVVTEVACAAAARQGVCKPARSHQQLSDASLLVQHSSQQEHNRHNSSHNHMPCVRIPDI